MVSLFSFPSLLDKPGSCGQSLLQHILFNTLFYLSHQGIAACTRCSDGVCFWLGVGTQCNKIRLEVDDEHGHLIDKGGDKQAQGQGQGTGDGVPE